MSSNTSTNQGLTTKDKITSHLPGHQNQDNNRDGIPDRLEKGVNVGNGGSVVPGVMQNTTTTTNTRDVNGLPISGNVLNDRVTQSSTVSREPAFVQQSGLNQGQGFTDLNRNGIPDQLEGRQNLGQQSGLNQGQGFGFIGSTSASTTSVVDVRQAPVVVERVEKAAVVHEVYKTEQVTQIQPVIERERERLDVYEVVQPMREREVVATEVRTATLPAQTRAVVVEDSTQFQTQRGLPGDVSTREVAATLHQTVENAPIVHETITHRVIEEIQPVIYKEIDRPVLIKETLPIYERIVEAPQAHHSVLPMRDMGTRTVTTTTTTGFTDLNRDGIPDQLQGGSYQTTGLQSGLQGQGYVQGQQGYVQGQQGFVQGQQYGNQVGGLNDLNRNGIPDNLERQGLQGQQGYVQGQQGYVQGQQYGNQVGGLNDLNRNGIPDNLENRQGQQGYVQGQQGFVQGQQGYVQGQQGSVQGQQGFVQGQQGFAQGQQGQQMGGGLLSQPQVVQQNLGQQGLGQQGLQGTSKDLNGNGIDDSLERRMGQTTLNQNQRL